NALLGRKPAGKDVSPCSGGFAAFSHLPANGFAEDLPEEIEVLLLRAERGCYGERIRSAAPFVADVAEGAADAFGVFCHGLEMFTQGSCVNRLFCPAVEK